jgi:hypothetical protein
MNEYHVDGFRFDLAKGFTQFNSGSDVNLWGQYDASRVAIWKDYYNYIRSIDPSFYVILEFFGSNQEEGELTNLGMLTWKNLATAGEQATMSYNDAGGSWDLSPLFYTYYFSFNNPYSCISYFESHDEERLQYKNEQYGNSNGSYNIKDIPRGMRWGRHSCSPLPAPKCTGNSAKWAMISASTILAAACPTNPVTGNG